ncbi:MAG: DNA polymerase I [Polyangia bacterium]
MSNEDALYLVDGSNFLFRAYHALPPLTTKSGVPSGAVYGFTQMLIRLEMEHKPKHLAVVFDAGARTFRNDLYGGYKANRPPPPDDLIPQFSLVREVVEAFGVRVLDARDVEADDLIATLTRRAKEAGQRVVIVSSDKDLMQLVDDRCVLLDTMKNVTYDTVGVTEKFGVTPLQLGDLLALMGDAIDNVPGIPGVGPKTAAALVQGFGSVEQLIARVDEIAALKGLRGAATVGEKVRTHADVVRLSRKLVALDEHAVLEVALDELVRVPLDPNRVGPKLRELEFTRLLDRLGPAFAQAAVPVPAVTAALPPPIAVVRSDLVTRLGNGPVQLVTDERSLRVLAGEVSRTRALGMSLWTSGGPSLTTQAVGLALAFPHRPPAYIPVGHRYLTMPPQVPAAMLALLGDALRTPRSQRYVHDAKEVELVLAPLGASLGTRAWDPALASYLVDPASDHTLPGIAARMLTDLLGAAGITELPPRESLTGTGKKASPIDSVEVERAAALAALEAEVALASGVRYKAELEARGLTKLNEEMELPLARVLAAIEPHGIRLDTAALHRMSEAAAIELARIEGEVELLAGQPINLGSPKQLQELLFEKLQLPPTRKTKTGFSTDADVLEELAPLHPVARKILDHRVVSKLKGTYLDALPLLVDPKNGRLHTSYRQTIAATGRLSSVEPNLQNVPIRTELGREIRRAFIADPGNKLVVADYSQIELRVLAHLSSDPVLTDAFANGEDVHERTVVEMFGEDRRHDKDMRRVAKMINYGIVYGLSDFGLADRLGIERADAKRYIDGYNRTYHGVATYMAAVIEEARRAGGARTLFGRFRPLPELGNKNQAVRKYGERMARNTPIQGTAADLLKMAMIDVQKLLEARSGPPTRMLLTVHDELVLEAPGAEAEEVATMLKATMENVAKLSVPLVVDVGVGLSWADAK